MEVGYYPVLTGAPFWGYLDSPVDSIADKELTMDCKVCGCAACYYNDCCDHKNPAPITEDVGYLDLFNEFLNESELPSYEKIVTKKKEIKREM